MGGKPAGCRSNGSCQSGGCNRLNVYNWLSDLPFSAPVNSFKVVEISFKNGSRKGFYVNSGNVDCHTGDMVVVDGRTGGYDVGQVSLSGELVRLQMRKKRVPEDAELPRLVRRAQEHDLEKLRYAREQEYPTMLMARVIARDLGLNMKVGDVEYQADGRKATFYYTADERVDFRDLIKFYAKEFKVKIEMRQIGARQEAGRIGGIGTCGRELCCSTWLTSFKSVSTVAARYQNLAINQSKLSGQCGRLKCCLNYELDTYVDALKDFPKDADFLKTRQGKARLIKTDIFKRLMWYVQLDDNKHVQLTVEQVKDILEMNAKGNMPDSLSAMRLQDFEPKAEEVGFEDGVGAVELDELKRRERADKKRRRRQRKKQQGDNNNTGSGRSNGPKSSGAKKPASRKPGKKQASGPKDASNQQKTAGKPISSNNKKGGDRTANNSKNPKPNSRNKNTRGPKSGPNKKEGNRPPKSGGSKPPKPPEKK